MNTPQEWEIPNWTDGGEVIDTRNIAQRIEDLEAEHVTADGEEVPVEDWPEVFRDEHRELTRLLGEISDSLPNGWDLSANGDAVIVVRDDHLDEYVKHWYADTYGGDLHTEDRYGTKVRLSWDDVMDREPFKWVDWEAAADEWRTRCSTVEYYGVTYYIDN